MKQSGSTYLLFFLTVWLFLSGCQRDDLCPETTQTTPMLIIRFFDSNEPDQSRSPTNLTIRDTQRDSILYYRVQLDSIALPLKTDTNTTEFSFTINAPEVEEEEEQDPDDGTGSNVLKANTDILSFSYSREEEYVNRACAFKVNYLDLRLSLDPGEDGNWMGTYIVEQIEVQDETQRHISIFY